MVILKYFCTSSETTEQKWSNLWQ